MLKRIFIVALCLCLLVVLVACKKGGDKGETELPVEENNTTESGTTDADTADENAGTDQSGSGTSDNNTRYDPDTGGVLLPWVP